MYLAADIGGTNARFVLSKQRWLADGSHPGSFDESSLQTFTYPSAEFANMDDLMAQVAGDWDLSGVKAACFGVAGPVQAGHVFLPNLNWEFGADSCAETLGVPVVTLINDIQAKGYGIPFVNPAARVVLQAPETSFEGEVEVLLSLGTGLGEAGILHHNKETIVIASEGGHSDFAPRSKTQDKLMEFLRGEFGQVSYERVLSGQGIKNIAEFFFHVEKEECCSQIQEAVTANRLKPELITKMAGDKQCKLSTHTLELMVEILGAEAANLALKYKAMGGVYLCGGIAGRILPYIQQDNRFLTYFTAKGRMGALLENIPVTVLTEDDFATIGALAKASTFESRVSCPHQI